MNVKGFLLGIFMMESFIFFNAKMTILATGGYGRAYFSCTSAHTCTGDGGGMVLRAGLPLQDMEFTQFHPTGIYGAGVLITEGARGEGGYLTNSAGRKIYGKICSKCQRSGKQRCCISIYDNRNTGGKRMWFKKDHIHLNLSHLENKILEEKLPGITESAKIFAGVDVQKKANSCSTNSALQHGRYSN